MRRHPGEPGRRPRSIPMADAAPPGRGKKIPLLAGALVLVLAGVGVVVLRMTRAAAATGESPPREFDPGVAELERFLLNLPSEAGDRSLRVQLQIVLDRTDVAERIDEEGLACARLRDRVLSVLAAQEPDGLTTPERQEALREELSRAIDPLLGQEPFLTGGDAEAAPARVLGIYFTEFLLQ